MNDLKIIFQDEVLQYVKTQNSLRYAYVSQVTGITSVASSIATSINIPVVSQKKQIKIKNIIVNGTLIDASAGNARYDCSEAIRIRLQNQVNNFSSNDVVIIPVKNQIEEISLIANVDQFTSNLFLNYEFDGGTIERLTGVLIASDTVQVGFAISYYEL